MFHLLRLLSLLHNQLYPAPLLHSGAVPATDAYRVLLQRRLVFTGRALANVMIMASNSNVNPLPERAHGTLTLLTPHLLHLTLGTLAIRYVSCSKKFTCRHFFSSVSYAFTSSLPHSGQLNLLPRGKSILISLISNRLCCGSKSDDVTRHAVSIQGLLVLALYLSLSL